MEMPLDKDVLTKMTKKEADLLIRTMKAHRREACKSPEAARKFLIERGFLTPSGRTPKRYRQHAGYKSSYSQDDSTYKSQYIRD